MTIKRTLLLFAVIVTAALAVTLFAQQKPGPEIVQAGIDAYNAKNVAYFEKYLAEDVVLIDEDGHTMSGKSGVLGFLKNQLTDPTPRKLTVKNIKVGSTSDAAWAYFAYTIDHEGKPQHTGSNSFVFRKAGNDWQIVLRHLAFDYPEHI